MGWAQPSRRWSARCRRAARRQVAPASLAAQPARWARSPRVGSEPRLQVAFEVEQQVASLGVEGEDGGVVAGWGGQAGCQCLEFQAVAVSDCRWDGWGAGLAAADQAGRQAVQEPSQQPAAAEPRPAGETLEDLGLDGQPDGQAGPLDVLGWSAAAVDLEQVAGVALEVDAEVGAGGLVVAAGHLVEHVPFGAEEGDAAVGGQQPGQGLGGGVIDQPPRDRRARSGWRPRRPGRSPRPAAPPVGRLGPCWRRPRRWRRPGRRCGAGWPSR